MTHIQTMMGTVSVSLCQCMLCFKTRGWTALTPTMMGAIGVSAPTDSSFPIARMDRNHCSTKQAAGEMKF
jgi:hypothetical protein